MAKKIDYREAIRLLKEGLNRKEISEKLNCNRSYLSFILTKNGYKRYSKCSSDIINLYNDGCSVPQIANKLNIAKQRIYQVLKDNNIKLTKRERKKTIPKYNPDEIIELRKENFTYKDIAEKNGCSVNTVYYILNKNNMIGKINGRLTEVVRLYNLGMTQKEISNKLNISQPYLSRLLTKNGISRYSKTDRVVQMYSDGKNPKEISTITGYSLSTIYKAITLINKNKRQNETQERTINMAQNKKVNHDEVIRLYRDEKCTIKQIINRLGISRQRIYTILKRNNIELSNPKYISHVIYDHDKIIRLRENKLSYPDIAKELGCSIGTVYHVLNKNNMIGKFKLGAKDDEIIKLYNSGMTQQAISSAIGISQSYVSKILRKDKKEGANMNNNQLIAKRYNDGATIKELANEFKLGQQRIRQILISEKIIVTRKHTTVITKEIRDIVHRLYFKAITPCNSDIEFPKDRTLNQKEIASIMNISRGSVDIIINKAKFISRAAGMMSLKDDILIAFDKFKSISEVTRTTGILEEIVEFVLLMHGVRKYLLDIENAKVLIYKLNELGFAKSLIADIVGYPTNTICRVLIKAKQENCKDSI